MRSAILACVLVVSCSDTVGIETVKAADKSCTFKFTPTPACRFKTDKHDVSISLVTRQIADNELELLQAKITYDGVEQAVAISPDTSMTSGKIGMMLFDDINFDGNPDIAVSTSFGLANQYFDYWVYNQSDKTMVKVGNLPKLTVDTANKTLSSSVKLNAANYKTEVYTWKDGKLVIKK